jgi:hypothetical protein
MIGHARTPNYVGLKPTWKGNLLLLLVAICVSVGVWLCFYDNVPGDTRDGARQVAARLAKLPAGSQR